MKGKNKILVFMLSICLLSTSTAFAQNTESLQNEIDKNKEAIEKLEQEKNNKNEELNKEESNLQEIEQKISSQSATLESARQKVNDYQTQINGLQSEINGLESKIIASENEIKTSEQKIVEIEGEIEEAQLLLDNRMRGLYKINIGQQYLYTLIKSSSISELISNVHNIGKIMNFDREIIQGMEDAQEEINKNIENIEKNIAIQKESKQVVEGKQSELVVAQNEFIALRDEEQRQMDSLMALQQQQASTIAQIEGNVQGIEGDILELTTFNKELQQQLNEIFANINKEESTVVPDSNGFLRPVTGVITSHFGPRVHPVTGQNSFHNGIDYGNDTGHPIKSTKSGVVSYSGWMNGYGNVVIVDHGGGVQSLYAHCSELYAGAGKRVERGEVIATVGSTGMSTGPHLHFEIRVNGQPQNPYTYIPY